MQTDVQLDAEMEAQKLCFLLFGSLRLLEAASETVDNIQERNNLLDAIHETISVAHARAYKLTDLAGKYSDATQA